MKARSGVGNFFLIAGAAFLLAGVGAVEFGGLGGSIAGLTFLLIGGIWVLVALGLRAFYGGMAKKAEQERRLFETGKRATATVEGVETTSMVMNEVNQQIVLRLTVRPQGEAEFTHERKMFVPFHGMPRTGDLIEVAYDSADRTKLALETDWRTDTAGGRLLMLRRRERARRRRARGTARRRRTTRPLRSASSSSSSAFSGCARRAPSRSRSSPRRRRGCCPARTSRRLAGRQAAEAEGRTNVRIGRA